MQRVLIMQYFIMCKVGCGRGQTTSAKWFESGDPNGETLGVARLRGLRRSPMVDSGVRVAVLRSSICGSDPGSR